MQGKIIVVGSINIDLVVKLDRLPKVGESMHSKRVDFFPGGKGANQAVGIKRLGGDVDFIGRVGDDHFGKLLIDSLRENRLRTDFISKDPALPTGMALIFIDKEGENMIVATEGANGNLSKDILKKNERIFKKSNILLLQLEISWDTIDFAIDLAKKWGLRVVLDAGPAKKCPKRILKKVDLISPNEIEAEVITGKRINSYDDAVKVGKELLNLPLKSVVLKLGKRGALYMEENKKEIIPAVKVKAIDTTAAGDAFMAAMVVALADGKSLRDAVEYGVYAGSLAVTKLGAQPSLPYKEELLRFIKGKR